MAKRKKHICGVEGILHDPAECPACERVEAGEPALGLPEAEALTVEEQAYIMDLIDNGKPVGAALTEKLSTGRLAIHRAPIGRS